MTGPVVSGAQIAGELLRAHAPLTAFVPAERIKRGRLPDNAPIPSIVVVEISQVERQPLAPGETVHTADRVAVTGRFATSDQRTQVMDIIKRCLRGRTGTLAGVPNVSILTAGRGPDLNGPGNSFEKTADFRVFYNA